MLTRAGTHRCALAQGIERRCLGGEGGTVSWVDDNYARGPHGAERAFEDAVEIVPVGPVAYDDQVPIEQADPEPLLARSDAASDRLEASSCPGAHTMLSGSQVRQPWILRSGAVSGEGRYAHSVDADADLSEQQLTGGLNQPIDIGGDRGLDALYQEQIGHCVMARVWLAGEGIAVDSLRR